MIKDTSLEPRPERRYYARVTSIGHSLAAETPTVSVIVPVYNAEQYLGDALDSVTAQNYPAIEIIAVDDGSSDRSADILNSGRYPVRYVRQENSGPAAARNVGLGISSGDIIAFIDADDIWPTHKLSLQLSYLRENPGVDITLGKIQYIGDLSERERNIRFESAGQITQNVNLGSGLSRREVFDTVGRFDETLIHYEDHDWFLRARELSTKIFIMDEVTLLYRRHAASLSQAHPPAENAFAQVFKKSLDRRRRMHEGHSPELRKFFEHDKS